MKPLITLFLIMVAFVSYGQKRQLPLIYDTTITEGELKIRNATKSNTGAFLRNRGDGASEWAYAVDTTYISGANLVVVIGGRVNTYALPSAAASSGNTVASIADLKNKPVNAASVRTMGYRAAGDGGDAEWFWDPFSALTPDDQFVVQSTLTGTGRWIRIVNNNAVHIKSLGIYGDNRTTEVAAIKAAVEKASSKGYIIRYEGTILNLNGDSLSGTYFYNFQSAVRGAGIIRNGKFINPRGGMTSEGMGYEDFTAGVIYTDTAHGGVKRPVNNRWTLKFYRNTFRNNQYDFREGSGAGKRDSTLATGPRLINCEFIGNYFHKSKYASFQLDMLYSSVQVLDNIWDSTGDPATYNYTLNIGMDGQNNSNKEDGLIIDNNIFKNIIHTQAESGTFYMILARGRGMKFTNNQSYNGGGPAYFGGDNLVIDNNYFEQWRNYVKYAIVVKDVNKTGNITINNNQLYGYYGSGIYVETAFHTANIKSNSIRLEIKDANNGIAAIRVIGDQDSKTLNIKDNDIINNQTNSGTNAIFLSTSGTFETVNINENNIESKAVGISAKLINSCSFLNISDNEYIRSVQVSSLGAKKLKMHNNNFKYTLNWVNLYVKDQALISENHIDADTSMLNGAGVLSRMFNVETDPDVNNCEYTFAGNFVDKRKLTNMVRLEDSTAAINVYGDQVIYGEVSSSAAYVNSVTNASLNLKVNFDGFINPYNAPAFASSTDNQQLYLSFKDSKIGRDALISLTGIGQQYKSLIVDNCELPTNYLNVSQVFEIRKFIAKRDINRRSLGSPAYTLTDPDIILGRSNVLEAGLSTPITITVPLATTSNLAAGESIKIFQTGAGAVTLSPAAGVTIVSPNGLSTNGLNQFILLEKVTPPNGWRAVVLGGATGDAFDHSTLARKSYVDSLETNYDATEFQINQDTVRIGVIEQSKINGLPAALSSKQATLVSGTNIKSVNNISLLGSGNINISGGVWGAITGTLSSQTDLQNALTAKQDATTAVNTTANQTIAGTKTFSSFPVISSLTQNSLLFAGTGGVIAQNTNSLVWLNSSGGKLGIGTSAPSEMLHVRKNIAGNLNPQALFQEDLTNGYAQIGFQAPGRRWHFGVGGNTETFFNVAGKFFIYDNTADAIRFSIATTGVPRFHALTGAATRLAAISSTGDVTVIPNGGDGTVMKMVGATPQFVQDNNNAQYTLVTNTVTTTTPQAIGTIPIGLSSSGFIEVNYVATRYPDLNTVQAKKGRMFIYYYRATGGTMNISVTVPHSHITPLFDPVFNPAIATTSDEIDLNVAASVNNEGVLWTIYYRIYSDQVLQ